MSLKKTIEDDLKKAFKAQDRGQVSVLRLLLDAIFKKEKQKRQKIAQKEADLSEEKLQEKSALTDEEILEVIASESKKRKEAILAFEKGNREELAEKEKAELRILEQYLPEQLSEEELNQLIEKTIQETGAQGPKDIGRVMGALVPQIKGKAETSQAAQIVKEKLSPKQPANPPQN